MADDFDIEALLEAPYNESNKKPLLPTNTNESVRDDRGRSRSKSKSRTDRKRSRSREKRRSRDRDHKRARSRGRSRSKERSRARSRDRERARDRKRSRSKSRDRERKRRSRSRSRERRRRSRSTSRDRYRRSRERRPKSVSREDKLLVDADQRTVLCMQLSQRVTQRDLDVFFGAVGKVREVRLIIDNKTRRHKGVAYIEFREPESVPLALALSGQKLGGYPIQIQPTHAQKNRPNAVNNTPANPPADPISHPPVARRHFPNLPGANTLRNRLPVVTSTSRLYVGSLHFHITEDMLRSIFEPFGPILKIELIRDPDTQRSKGYGFVTYVDTEHSKRALEQLNGFELAGRPMKVNHANERAIDLASAAFMNVYNDGSRPSSLDTEDVDRTGVGLKASNRLQLMAKLAEGTGMQVPQMPTSVVLSSSHSTHTGALLGTNGDLSVKNGVSMSTSQSTSNNQTAITATSSTTLLAESNANAGSDASNNNSDNLKTDNVNHSIATSCFMLSNMFDPNSEQGDDWHDEIRTDVIEECRPHGGALHVFVDKFSQGNVYVKCASRHVASGCVTALHGRWFSGRLITAAYIPEEAYHQLFVDSINAVDAL